MSQRSGTRTDRLKSGWTLNHRYLPKHPRCGCSGKGRDAGCTDGLDANHDRRLELSRRRRRDSVAVRAVARSVVGGGILVVRFAGADATAATSSIILNGRTVHHQGRRPPRRGVATFVVKVPARGLTTHLAAVRWISCCRCRYRLLKRSEATEAFAPVSSVRGESMNGVPRGCRRHRALTSHLDDWVSGKIVSGQFPRQYVAPACSSEAVPDRLRYRMIRIVESRCSPESRRETVYCRRIRDPGVRP